MDQITLTLPREMYNYIVAFVVERPLKECHQVYALLQKQGAAQQPTPPERQTVLHDKRRPNGAPKQKDEDYAKATAD